MIYVVNFPFCNYHSFARYLNVRSLKYQAITQRTSMAVEDILVLPGVGTFKQGMDYLMVTGLKDQIQRHVSEGGKLLGICLGMQMLLEESDESPNTVGLSVISGTCKKIRSKKSFAVPHIGWNSIRLTEFSTSDFEVIGPRCGESNSDYYFVHSYHAHTLSMRETMATFNHPEGDLAAIIARDNIIGLQFHPEKSGRAGYELLDQLLR